ncbi:MAG: 2-dehydro-3-deoxy-D-gluconate 5-dehydrogenase KduD [Opitutaceae bacterium]|nr:2-dehydro-3-deoxy-D-gluconate 5-dehydrogenase KduD [Opitutaceae bacterium]
MSAPQTFSLDGRIALVTGASKGLGASMAHALAAAGADVILVSRRPADTTAAAIRTLGRKAWILTADLSVAEEPARVFEEALGAAGNVDILVNNAGIIRRANFVDFSEADWTEVMATNLDSAFRLSQLAARNWISSKRQGKIIHVASMLSFQGGVRVASYTAAKSALHGLTKLMANELAIHGINVNAIAPGYMATENTEALRADANRNQAILDRIPAGRWGEPSDLDGAVVFLASAASHYVHGFTLAVDGGWLAR